LAPATAPNEAGLDSLATLAASFGWPVGQADGATVATLARSIGAAAP
jgi:hypothetical protein